MTKMGKISNNEVRAWQDRRDKRFKEENEVLIEWVQHTCQEYNNRIYAFTQDLSVGGAKIVTDIDFPVNTIFMITLTLSRSKQIIKVAAKVRWVKSLSKEDMYEVGLQFIHDFPQTVSSLLRHLFGHELPQDVALEMAQIQNEEHRIQSTASPTELIEE